MKDQHTLIKGYGDLSADEITAMNLVKEKAAEVGEVIAKLEQTTGLDQRWVAIAKIDLQKGFMAAVRAIAQPTSF